MAKYYCVRLHALFGMALASGLVLARNGVLAWQNEQPRNPWENQEHPAVSDFSECDSLPSCSELLIQQQNRLNVENDCSTELVQFCQEMERRCQGGTRWAPVARIGREVAVATRVNEEVWTSGAWAYKLVASGFQHPAFAQGTRLLRFDWLGLLVHGQITVACGGGSQYELNSKPGGRTSHVTSLYVQTYELIMHTTMQISGPSSTPLCFTLSPDWWLARAGFVKLVPISLSRQVNKYCCSCAASVAPYWSIITLTNNQGHAPSTWWAETTHPIFFKKKNTRPGINTLWIAEQLGKNKYIYWWRNIPSIERIQSFRP